MELRVLLVLFVVNGSPANGFLRASFFRPADSSSSPNFPDNGVTLTHGECTNAAHCCLTTCLEELPVCAGAIVKKSDGTCIGFTTDAEEGNTPNLQSISVTRSDWELYHSGEN